MPFKASAHEFDQGCLRLVALSGARGSGNLRLQAGVGPDGLGMRQPFSRNPERRRARCYEPGCAARICQLVQPICPAILRLCLGFGEEAKPDHGIVQLIEVGRVGPRFLAHARDSCSIKLAEFGR